MTTTKENGKQAKAALGDGWDDAPKASSGESDVPAWCPHFSTWKDEVIEQKLKAQPDGSHIRPVLVGTLTVQQAFGEPRYFVDELDSNGVKGKTVRMALPNHGALTASLDSIRLDPPPTVRIGYQGEAKRSRPNQRAAFLYDVRVKPADALLKDKRADALLPIHKENKRKRDAMDAGEIDE